MVEQVPSIMGPAKDPMAGLLSGLDGLGGMFVGPRSMKDMRLPADQDRSTATAIASTSSKLRVSSTPGQTTSRWNSTQGQHTVEANTRGDPFAGIHMNTTRGIPSQSPVR